VGSSPIISTTSPKTCSAGVPTVPHSANRSTLRLASRSTTPYEGNDVVHPTGACGPPAATRSSPGPQPELPAHPGSREQEPEDYRGLHRRRAAPRQLQPGLRSPTPGRRGPAFSPVVCGRQGEGMGSWRACSKRWGKPGRAHSARRDSSILYRPSRRPGPLGTMQGQTGAVWSRAAPTQHRRPENLATRQRQPQPLRRAIPTLTGAVLVVNAPGRAAAPCSAHRRLTLPERCRSPAAAGLSIWLQG
jgi:hypothetical protein